MQYKTIFNDMVETNCQGCADRTLPALSKLKIAQTEHWNVEQDWELAYPAMVILVPKRHFSSYADMNDNEAEEFHKLIVKTELNIKKLFKYDRFASLFYEKPGSHFHSINIPVFDFMNIKNSYNVLGEIMDRSEELAADAKNMKLVSDTIIKLRELFNQK